eukprot:Amastigsp_a524723_7.p3 type:complete len:131 gc:universal Amastigsp_a524723_7:717-325(-)
MYRIPPNSATTLGISGIVLEYNLPPIRLLYSNNPIDIFFLSPLFCKRQALYVPATPPPITATSNFNPLVIFFMRMVLIFNEYYLSAWGFRVILTLYKEGLLLVEVPPSFVEIMPPNIKPIGMVKVLYFLA